MPSYDYRCNHCGRRIMLTYRSYKAYDEATPTCPHCDSTDLTRLISRVSIAKSTPNYGNMSSNEMLSVLEGGDSREVGQMFKQVGESVPGADREYHEAADRLLRGDSMDSVEADLRAKSEQQVNQDRQQTKGSGKQK